MNVDEWFVDTGYWLAWLNRDDELHHLARSLTTQLPAHLVTTEAVLLESGNAMSRPPLRPLGVSFLTQIRTNPRVIVVPLDSHLLDRAIALYAARPDKEWGLVDCTSFIVMQDRGITQALAADQHFVQAGFRALLRD